VLFEPPFLLEAHAPLLGGLGSRSDSHMCTPVRCRQFHSWAVIVGTQRPRIQFRRKMLDVRYSPLCPPGERGWGCGGRPLHTRPPFTPNPSRPEGRGETLQKCRAAMNARAQLCVAKPVRLRPSVEVARPWPETTSLLKPAS
jgi:hypothetical protein